MFNKHQTWGLQLYEKEIPEQVFTGKSVKCLRAPLGGFCYLRKEL